MGLCRVSDFEQTTVGNASMLGTFGAAAGVFREAARHLEDLGGKLIDGGTNGNRES
jgi:hypothetical protein